MLLNKNKSTLFNAFIYLVTFNVECSLNFFLFSLHFHIITAINSQFLNSLYFPKLCCWFYGLYLPQQFTEHSGGELWVFPAAEAQQFDGLLRVTAILNDLLHVTGTHKKYLSHHLMQRHDGLSQAGIPIRISKRRVTYTRQT